MTGKPESRRRRRFIPLRLIIAGVLLAAFIPGAALLTTLQIGTRNAHHQDAVTSSTQIAKAVASDIADRLNFTDAQLNLLHEFIRLHALDAAQCGTILPQALENRSWLTSLWTTNAAGLAVCSAPQAPQGMSRANRIDFLTAMADQRISAGLPQRGQLTGEYVIPVSRPIIDDQKRSIGTVGGAIRIASLLEPTRTIGLPADTIITILSFDGTILYRSPEDASVVGERPRDQGALKLLSQASVAATATQPVIAQFTATYMDGVERMVVAHAIPSLRLWAVVGVNMELARAQANRQAIFTAVAMVLLLGILFVLVTWGLNRVVLFRLRQTASDLDRLTTGAVELQRLDTPVFNELHILTAKIARASRSIRRSKEAAKSAATLLQSVLDNSVDGIIMIDPAGNILVFNRTAEKIFGYSREEVLGRNVAMLMPEPYQSGHDNYVSKFMGGGRPKIIGIGRTVEGRRKDGSVFPMDLGVAGVPDPVHGRVFVGTVRDVTQRVELEAQLREHQKMEALGQLTGGIAHDFNNLLAVILGNLEVASDYLPEGSIGRSSVDTAIRATDNAASLTQRLLAFARRMPLKPQLVEINQLIADGAELYRRALGENVHVETAFGPGPLRVNVDPAQLQVALLNLAVNARDAMPRGGRLKVSTSRTPVTIDGKSLECAVIAIADNGTGMAPEVLAKATEPFFTTKEPGAGTGLGLSMVHGFAAQSGGGLSIESALGVGTTVRLSLPLSDQETVELDVADPVLDLELRPSPGTTVLVVEDDSQVRETVATMLRMAGYTVILAPDGESAVTLLGSPQRIDLLLTDMVLPGALNGLDVAHAARRLRPEAGILCMSGYTDPLRGVDPQAVAEFTLLNKPFTRQQLAQALRWARR